MEKIDFNSKIEGKRQAAFVIFYALDGQPWLNYDDKKPAYTNLVIPTCLIMNRSDGAIGFIGGKVEEGETLEQAAIREVGEEIGYKVSVHLEPLVAHDIGAITSHAFIAEMKYSELRKIQDETMHAMHFGSEVTGVFLPHLIDYTSLFGKGGGIVTFLQSPMAPSVREELVHLLLAKNIFSKDDLVALTEKAGYNLETLLT
jgi:8-oxo-dGTP pyrophosphatase MutT (NUDIX family)